MASSGSPDQIIKDLGGCGRYQMLISIITHVMKLLICWAVMSMVILSRTPPWWCDVEADTYNSTETRIMTDGDDVVEYHQHFTNVSMYGGVNKNGTNDDVLLKACVAPGGEQCTKFRYGGSSLVSEFDLVCDMSFTPSVIMSIQNAGSLAGNLIAGQISDLFGRKRPFFGAVGLITVALFVGYFANHWTLFAASRFCVGFGASAFMTTKYSLLSEFTLSSHRAWIIGFPSWPIEAAMLAGVAFLLQGNWKNIQLTIGLIGFPCLLAWWTIPESFRWYLSHDREEEAQKILDKVAKFNKKPLIPLKQLEEINLTGGQKEEDRKYTILDLFKSKYLIKLSILLSVQWLALGFISYGISFGIQALSGNVFMNFFLFNVTGIPSKAIAIWLENRFGRKKTSILCFFVTAVGGLAAGIVYYIDTPNQATYINAFALVANIGITTAWGPIQTITIELYPTVIRSIGFGTLSVVGRAGAIIGPQIVFLSTKIPGLIYLVCGGLSVLCMIALLGVNETKDKKLNDKLSQTNDDA